MVNMHQLKFLHSPLDLQVVWTPYIFFIKVFMFHLDLSRDVYCIGSILSYWYHETDSGIVSKWQINDTFKDTFYDDINMDRASLTQKLMIFFN